MTDWHDTSTPVGRIRAVLDSGSFVVPASVLTVPQSIEAGHREHRATLASLTAPADEAVTDDPHRTHTEQVVVAADSDRQDAGSVEHTRQSRLQRWQAQPDAR